MNVVNWVCISFNERWLTELQYYNIILKIIEKGSCVQLRAKWHETGASIHLSVRPAGVKDFVDIIDTDNLIKNVNSVF